MANESLGIMRETSLRDRYDHAVARVLSLRDLLDAEKARVKRHKLDLEEALEDLLTLTQHNAGRLQQGSLLDGMSEDAEE